MRQFNILISKYRKLSGNVSRVDLRCLLIFCCFVTETLGVKLKGHSWKHFIITTLTGYCHVWSDGLKRTVSVRFSSVTPPGSLYSVLSNSLRAFSTHSASVTGAYLNQTAASRDRFGGGIRSRAFPRRRLTEAVGLEPPDGVWHGAFPVWQRLSAVRLRTGGTSSRRGFPAASNRRSDLVLLSHGRCHPARVRASVLQEAAVPWTLQRCAPTRTRHRLRSGGRAPRARAEEIKLPPAPPPPLSLSLSFCCGDRVEGSRVTHLKSYIFSYFCSARGACMWPCLVLLLLLIFKHMERNDGDMGFHR